MAVKARLSVEKSASCRLERQALNGLPPPPSCKPERGAEFNALWAVLPMLLLQPVIQYYANVGGRTQRAVVFGFRTKVEF